MKWIIRISNTHRDIAIRELEILLSVNSYEWIMPLLVLVDAEQETIDFYVSRSASVKWVMKRPQIIEFNHSIKSTLKEVDYSVHKLIEPPQTFAVRFNQLMNTEKYRGKQQIERLVGSKILELHPTLKVNLDNPTMYFRVINFQDKLVLGWIYTIVDFQRIENRSPKNSPFFGGGAMKSMLSKTLVNLLTPLSPLVLDPFCGHGGFLREISATGNFALGIEINSKIARECKINNNYHDEEAIQVIIGDALNQPFRRKSISQVVSDPPYAHQSTTKGRDREELVEEWLKKSDQRELVITLPDSMNIDIPSQFKLKFTEKDYVHNSLTRVVRKLVMNS